MKKIFSFLMLMIISTSLCFGNVEVFQRGTQVGGTAVRLDFRGGSVTGVGTDKTINVGLFNEVITATTDTLTAAESPRRVISTDSTGQTWFALPTAAEGLHFAFASGENSPTTSNDTSFRVIPQSTDTIHYLTLDVGDRLLSSGATGDSLELFGGTNIWYVIDTGSNAFTDDGQ